MCGCVLILVPFGETGTTLIGRSLPNHSILLSAMLKLAAAVVAPTRVVSL